MSGPSDEDLLAEFMAMDETKATGFLFAAMVDVGLLRKMPPGQWCLIARGQAMPLPPSLNRVLDAAPHPRQPT